MDFIEIFKALGDEIRIRILNLLNNGELCVCEIEAILQITQSNASRHLNKLKNTGIVENKKVYQWVFYKLNESFIEENKLLYQYLSERFKEIPECTSDLQRLKKYKQRGLSCKDLNEDRDKVLKYLENGE